MKRDKISIIILITLFAIAIVVIFKYPIAVRIFEKIAKKEITYAAFSFPPNSFFEKYLFPLKVSAFTHTLGNPNSTYVDDNENCPIGQMHTWDLQDKNIEILVLGDDYKSRINYGANSRLYAVRKCNIKAPSAFEGVWGIKLGDPDTTIKNKLEELIKKDPSLQLTQDVNGSPVHCHLVRSDMKHQYVLRKKNVYLFFIIGDSGDLETIMFTTFDVRAAC